MHFLEEGRGQKFQILICFSPFIKSSLELRWISGMEIFVTICAPYFHVENRGFKIYWLVETNITNAISLDRGVNVLSNCNQPNRSLENRALFHEIQPPLKCIDNTPRQSFPFRSLKPQNRWKWCALNIESQQDRGHSREVLNTNEIIYYFDTIEER